MVSVSVVCGAIASSSGATAIINTHIATATITIMTTTTTTTTTGDTPHLPMIERMKQEQLAKEAARLRAASSVEWTVGMC